MPRNAAVTQQDGSIRARIVQGTQHGVGPLLIGVMGAHGAEDGQRARARLELLVHRSLAVASPGVVRLQEGESVTLDGIGHLVLAAVEPAEELPPQQAPTSDQRAAVFLELHPG